MSGSMLLVIPIYCRCLSVNRLIPVAIVGATHFYDTFVDILNSIPLTATFENLEIKRNTTRG